MSIEETKHEKALNVLAELYQILGALDAPEHVLDQVSAAANGHPLPHETLLPFTPAPAGQAVWDAKTTELITQELDELIDGFGQHDPAVGIRCDEGVIKALTELRRWVNTTPPQADRAEGWDAQAYATMRDEVEYWKRRALEADEALERIREDMSPTHMGEPLIPLSQIDRAGERVREAWLAGYTAAATSLSLGPIDPESTARDYAVKVRRNTARTAQGEGKESER